MEPAEEEQILIHLLDVSDNAPSLRQKAHLLARLHEEGSDDAKCRLDNAMVRELAELGDGLRKAVAGQEQLAEKIEDLIAPPWHPWVFRGLCVTSDGDQAVVSRSGTTRIVTIGEDVDAALLVVGDEVLLSDKMNVIMAQSPWGPPRFGETALFDRLTGEGGRLVVKSRDEEFVVEPAGRLDIAQLKSGDEVRWDRTEQMAYEKIDRSEGTGHFLEDPPDVTFDDIGGLDDKIVQIKETITLHMKYPEVVESLDLDRAQTILLEGPPGGGKTMLAQALANWVGRLTGSGKCRFINVKPGGMLSMWYGQSEANIRELFRVAREEGRKNPKIPVVIFFDEVDSIGRNRGSSLNQANDRVVEALTAELQGLELRGNILVLAATNRAKDMSAALLRPGRFGDLRISVPRPNMAAARAIFGKHLPAKLPYETPADSRDQAAARAGLIDAAVAAIYAPNGANCLAKVTMRDNTRRIVTSADLVSGASIHKVARVATQALALRMVAALESGHQPRAEKLGIRLDDILTAIIDEFTTTASVLTRDNIRRYVSDLPQESDVTSVELIQRRVLEPHRYINLSVE